MSLFTDMRRPLLGLAAGTLFLASLVGAAPSAVGSSAPRGAIGNVVHVPKWDLTPRDIARSCAAEIAVAKQRVDAIVRARSARTFESVGLAFENVSSDLNDTLAAQQFLFSVSTDAAVRSASQKCGTDVGSFYSEVSARPDLYAALKAARASHTASSPADRTLLDFAIVSGVRSGAALSPAKRQQFVALSKKLNDLQAQFAANLGNEATTITISAGQATGIPADTLATFKKDATGNLIVPVNESTYQRFMLGASDSATRRIFYTAFLNRGGNANVNLLQNAIAVRDRLAHLLGYRTWAAFTLADRMAATPERVNAFLGALDAALLPKAKSDLAQVAALKGSAPDAWDVRYYENQIRKSQFSVDNDAIKRYFPVQHTVDSVLAIYSELLGVKMTRTNLPSWHPDVVSYNVNDANSGAYIGSFYLDLFPRPGKYSHFANSGINARRTLPDGTVRASLNTILGNWPVASPGSPALLTHDDVVTFFHEFGHNMAAMLSATPYETLNSGFRWDFVEAPSQMLENWVWNPTILKRLSSEATTGAPLPDELIEKMVKARYFFDAYDTVSQIGLATVDMRYHTSGANVDTTAVWKRTVAELTPSQFVDGTHPQASFGHLMSGYDAGYYGYLWSKVYAQDMFTAFERAGLTNAAVGRRYRDDILAPARSIEPALEVTHFLGRPMSPNAFYQELGVTPPAAM